MFDLLEALGHFFEFTSWGIRKAFGIREPEDTRPLFRAQNIACGAVVVVAIFGVLIGMVAVLLNR